MHTGHGGGSVTVRQRAPVLPIHSGGGAEKLCPGPLRPPNEKRSTLRRHGFVYLLLSDQHGGGSPVCVQGSAPPPITNITPHMHAIVVCPLSQICPCKTGQVEMPDGI